jgi:hypothetical protein
MKPVSVPLRPALMACVAAGLTTQSLAFAQDLDVPQTSGWSVRLGAVSRFNIKTTVSNVAPATGAGLYDDGFVLPDNSGTASGKTWNWGYTSATQIAGDQLMLHHLDGVSSVGQQDSSNPAFGGEIVVGYSVYEFQIGKKAARVGIEFGYGYSTLSGNMSSAGAGNATLTTDGYKLNGILPPAPPYAGTAAGPGPLIDLGSSSHTVATAQETTSFQGSLNVNFHELRLGPTLEIDLTKRLSVSAGFGYSAVYADASLDYNESILFNNPAFTSVGPHSATINKTEWRPGVYGNLLLNFRITKLIGVFAGGDYRYNEALNFGDAGHNVKMDLGSTIGAKGGISFSF